MKKNVLRTYVEENYYDEKIFRYNYGKDENGEDLYVNLTILRPAHVSGYHNLYLCHLSYTHEHINQDDIDTFGEMIGLSEVIMSFDKERLYKDSNYADYILKTVLNKDRIQLLYDVEYNDAPGKKLGNYIGTIVEDEKGLHVFLDDELGQVASESEISRKMHMMFDYYMGLSNEKPMEGLPRKKVFK